MKKVLGLDLGTNSIGWALVAQDFENKKGEILGLGSRIIPMSQDILGKFDAGQSHSQTAERTNYRGVRRLYQRDNLRRERLHRVLQILSFLPEHYSNEIDFEKKKGQFFKNKEPKITYFKNEKGHYEFLFKDSFNEMVEEFKKAQPDLFYIKSNGQETKIPYDWTIYYLR
ncbi:MAG: CRISPR-associated protein Csn1, partial [Crocinitomicaceae bacterium]|nr:CRISPR-associated protein Csn1 [Crocinitomicaceae bacterium]